ncbi:MAG: aldolase/citrate lyase family protein [Pseudomonadota bacterium]
MSRIATFRQRLASGELCVGTFVKTPSPIVAEVLGLTELDVCCLDAEHAPFGRLELDGCVAMLRAADMPSLVRVASDHPTDIRNALDCGATGILVPHVVTAEQARAIVRSAQFGEGGRGYAGSTRAARYTTKPMSEHMRDSAAGTTVVVQIEDLAALDQVDAIARVNGVDALFVGRADLAAARGCSVSDPDLIATVAQICATAGAAGKTVGMFTPALDEIAGWRERGARFFLLDSDHGFILKGAAAMRAAVHGAETN